LLLKNIHFSFNLDSGRFSATFGLSLLNMVYFKKNLRFRPHDYDKVSPAKDGENPAKFRPAEINP
jgi:hypothetical protein